MKGRQGFTLMELLIVVVIIAIISAIAIPQYNRLRREAEDAELLITLTALSDAIWMYRNEAGDFPPQSVTSELYQRIGVSVPVVSNYFQYGYTYSAGNYTSGGNWPVSGLSGVISGLRFDLNANSSDEPDGYYLGYSKIRLSDAVIDSMKINRVKYWQVDDTWYRYSWCIVGEHAS